MIVFRLPFFQDFFYWIIFVSWLNIISLSFESCLIKFCICYTELDIIRNLVQPLQFSPDPGLVFLILYID